MTDLLFKTQKYMIGEDALIAKGMDAREGYKTLTILELRRKRRRIAPLIGRTEREVQTL